MKYLRVSKWNSKRHSFVKRKRKRKRERRRKGRKKEGRERERKRENVELCLPKEHILFFLLVRTVPSEVLELDAQSNDALECYHRYSHDLVANK